MTPDSHRDKYAKLGIINQWRSICICTKSMLECIWGIRPQLQRTVYLIFAIIAIYLTGSHWDVSVLQPYPLHSCLTYYVFLLSTLTSHFTSPYQTNCPTLIFQFRYTLPSLSETTLPIIPSHSARLMCSRVSNVVFYFRCLQLFKDRTSKDVNQDSLLPSLHQRNKDIVSPAPHLWLLLVMPFGHYITRHDQPTRHSSIPQLMAG